VQRQDIIEKINSTLAENFELGPEKLKADAHIINDLHLDSLDAVDMLVHLEDKLGKKLDVERLREARTLNDIYNLVEETLK
jgi:acyl carrier protein